MFYEIFLSSQVKRSVIITNKHGIYELPHELPKDIIRNSENIGAILKLHIIITYCPVSTTPHPPLPPETKIMPIVTKDFLKTKIEIFL